jgi:hypothetical protein
MNPLTQKKLQAMRDSVAAFALFGRSESGAEWSKELQATFEERLKKPSADLAENNKKLGKLFERYHAGDMEASHALNELIITTTQNFVLPNLVFGRFFEVKTLGEKDSPGEINLTRSEFKCKVISQDNGTADIVKITKERRTVTHDLFAVVTPRVEWTIRDLYKGNIENAAQVMVDIAEVIGQEIEKRLHPEGSTWIDGQGALETGVYGAFTLTGAKSGRVWVKNSMVRDNNLPTTNELSIASVGGSTTFGFSSFDAIIAYCQRFIGTRDVDGSGDLAPTGEVYVPVLDAPEILTGITAVTGAKGTPISEQLTERGWMEIPRYGGIDWKVIPVQTIARKKLYARLNRPVGTIYFKPSEDAVDEQADKMKNIAWRQEKKVLSIVIPLPNVRNTCRVAYRT